MRIELNEDLERYLRDQVAAGKFPSESAVVETAVRLMRDRAERRTAVRLAMMEEEDGVPLHWRN